MRSFIYKLHLLLGLAAAVPLLGWAASGFLYSIPNAVEGGVVEKIAAERVRVSPAEAIESANRLAGRELPTTALTLLMKDGRPRYQSIGGLGADSIFIDAETGIAEFSKPPTARTRFFREAHFYFFAGRWQVPLLLVLSAIATLSVLTGIYLNVVYWGGRLLGRRRKQLAEVVDE